MSWQIAHDLPYFSILGSALTGAATIVANTMAAGAKARAKTKRDFMISPYAPDLKMIGFIYFRALCKATLLQFTPRGIIVNETLWTKAIHEQ
jgi:hypothetical protein